MDEVKEEPQRETALDIECPWHRCQAKVGEYCKSKLAPNSTRGIHKIRSDLDRERRRALRGGV